MAKLAADPLEIARQHLARASAELERAAAALEEASARSCAEDRDRLALVCEVVNIQKDMAAGVAAVVKAAPDATLDLLLASIAFSRVQSPAAGRH